MTGANFAVAETGTVVVCTNEGNADLSVNLPPLYIASIGIEKIIPKIEHLGVFVRMLSRSALGSPITQLTSHFRAPRPGTEMHIVLVDNGRSERLGMADFWHFAQMHPLRRVHEHLSGVPAQRRPELWRHLFGADRRHHRSDVQSAQIQRAAVASTLNGSCTSVCPVKHQHSRADLQVAPGHRREQPAADVKKEAMQIAGKSCPARGSTAQRSRPPMPALEHLPRFMIYSRLNAWGRQREVPQAPAQTFRQWYLKHRAKRRSRR